ncbi:monovalent cation:H+ antiporter, CPA1 family [Paraglaciecola arctica BSs20135]|uniref:Monovalent cation:H+ antiporter, CPA1 family n=2 Tax=Paraglaciecola TaxID=1621534 RepID=K6ZEX0_9ALTE|nr:monovalent cation:H+ antiporter, CPA1 family [Paraglaciecola arctica BSs20135]
MICAKYSRLPLTLCILFWGMLSSFIIPMSGFDTGLRSDNFQDLILFVLIPILVFEAALNLNTKVMRPLIGAILFSATIGMIIAASIAAAIMYYLIGETQGFPWIAALITGLVISATDPVAVVTQLKEAKAPEKLATLIEGESLFNDATAIVLYGILLAIALGEHQVTGMGGVWLLVKVMLGGSLVGAVLAKLAIFILKVIPATSANYTVTSLALAYGSFYLAEHILNLSGIIAVLIAALVAKNALLGLRANKVEIHQSWEFLSFVANLFVFYLMGLVFTFTMFSDQWFAMLIGILAAFVSRLVACYVSIGFGKFVLKHSVEWNYGPVMVWGGLRGVVTIALVLSLPVELHYWWTIQSIGFGVVLFTLVVQATTNPWLVRKIDFKQKLN